MIIDELNNCTAYNQVLSHEVQNVTGTLQNVLVMYNNKISETFWLYGILGVIVALILVYIFYRLYCRFYREQNFLGIIMPSGKLEKVRVDEFVSKMEVKHSKNDVFDYLFDSTCYKRIKRLGRDRWIFYIYHVPRPIDLSNVNFPRKVLIDSIVNGKNVKRLVDVKFDVVEMDLHRFIHSTILEKFLMTKAFIEEFRIMLFILIGLTTLALLGLYLLYNHNPPTQCLYDNSTLTGFAQICKGVVVGK